MESADYRRRAYAALMNNRQNAVLTAFVYALLLGTCGSLAAAAGLGVLVALFLCGPLAYSLAYQSLKIVTGRRAEISDLGEFTKNYKTVLFAFLLNGVCIFFWTLLFIVPGIVAAYSYSMTNYVLADNPKLTATQAQAESVRLMDGNKLKLFKLHLSFIGWILLSLLTLGILFLFVEPYIRCATAAFYDALVPLRATVEHISAEPAPPPPDNNATDFDDDGPTIDTSIDPFDLDAEPAEPFYVFEEERPRKDDTISGK